MTLTQIYSGGSMVKTRGNLNKQELDQLEQAKPVSYTHLDVYKRKE